MLARCLAMIWLLLIGCAPAWATTKGLNQIVTPDIQPVGVLSVSYQAENSALGNPEQFQFELGLTNWFEIAIFQGLSPSETVYNAEIGLIQKKYFLLSTGLVGVENKAEYQPFIEAGYRSGKLDLIAGIQNQDAYFGVFGASYWATERLLIAADYISGPLDFATIGVTYDITPSLSFNPALYVSNRDHSAFGYGVLTWEITAW